MTDRPQTVKTLAADLAGDMPEGSAHLKQDKPQETGAGANPPPAPAAAGTKKPPATSAKPAGKSKGKKRAPVDYTQFAHLRDKHGFAFDPEVHIVEKDGTPKVTGDGLLWRKPGQRPKKSKSFIFRGGPQLAGDPGAPGEPGQPAPGTEDAHYQAAGVVMAHTITGMAQMFGGEEWKPAEHELAAMGDAWGNYLRAKGINDIPPGVAVTIAMLSYAGPRFAKPNTRKKVSGLVTWWKNRKKKKDKPDETSGDQGATDKAA